MGFSRKKKKSPSRLRKPRAYPGKDHHQDKDSDESSWIRNQASGILSHAPRIMTMACLLVLREQGISLPALSTSNEQGFSTDTESPNPQPGLSSHHTWDRTEDRVARRPSATVIALNVLSRKKGKLHRSEDTAPLWASVACNL